MQGPAVDALAGDEAPVGLDGIGALAFGADIVGARDSVAACPTITVAAVGPAFLTHAVRLADAGPSYAQVLGPLADAAHSPAPIVAAVLSRTLRFAVGHTLAILAGAVGAGEVVGDEFAARLRAAAIGGANIAVVAVERVSGDAPAAGAGISGGTDVTVIAGYGVGVRKSAVIGVAGVVCALVSVVAVKGLPFPARAEATDGVDRTRIAVIAG